MSIITKPAPTPRHEGQYATDKDGAYLGLITRQRRQYAYFPDGSRVALHNIGAFEDLPPLAPTYDELADLDALWAEIGYVLTCENPF